MFRLSAGVVVTLGFHYGPIRAPDRGGGGGNYRRPRHPSLSVPERRQVYTLTDGAAVRSADRARRKSERMTAARQTPSRRRAVGPNTDA